MRTIILKYKTQILYLICGVATTVFNIIAYYICYNLFRIDNVVSTIVAWLVSVLFAYITNKTLVFKNNDFGSLLKETTQFFLSRVATGFIDVAIMYAGVDLLALPGTPIKIIDNAIVIFLNYIVSKYIFASKKEKVGEPYEK